MHEYTCPECQSVLKSSKPAPEGKKIRCRECGHAFVPGAAPPKPSYVEEASGYGVIKEDDSAHAEERKAALKFDDVADKFKRSSRGPAMALMVLPTNLLVAQGGLMFVAGIGLILYGLFPLVFSEVEPSEDEYREQAGYLLFGFLIFLWSCLICFGASQMQNLESYTWAWVGALAGIPAGIFAMVMLRNPKVIAGFQEMVGALDDDEDNEKKTDDDDDDDDEDEDD